MLLKLRQAGWWVGLILSWYIWMQVSFDPVLSSLTWMQGAQLFSALISQPFN